MMPLFGQVSKLPYQIQLLVAVIKTSEAIFCLFCCRYVDSFIDIYHVGRGLISCHQRSSDLIKIRWRLHYG